jgi:hypothetical protein
LKALAGMCCATPESGISTRYNEYQRNDLAIQPTMESPGLSCRVFLSNRGISKPGTVVLILASD